MKVTYELLEKLGYKPDLTKMMPGPPIKYGNWGPIKIRIDNHYEKGEERELEAEDLPKWIRSVNILDSQGYSPKPTIHIYRCWNLSTYHSCQCPGCYNRSTHSIPLCELAIEINNNLYFLCCDMYNKYSQTDKKLHGPNKTYITLKTG